MLFSLGRERWRYEILFHYHLKDDNRELMQMRGGCNADWRPTLINRPITRPSGEDKNKREKSGKAEEIINS